MLAHRAAALRVAARRGSAVDALVVAPAESDGVVLTSDVGDLRALAAHSHGVIVECGASSEPDPACLVLCFVVHEYGSAAPGEPLKAVSTTLTVDNEVEHASKWLHDKAFRRIWHSGSTARRR